MWIDDEINCAPFAKTGLRSNLAVTLAS